MARHVAIIMDGNARWAREHGVAVLDGHREGAKALKQTVRNAVELGIEELTVYAFSTENWSRPDDEVNGLMAMFAELIESETPELHEEGVQMRFIGAARGGVRGAAQPDGGGEYDHGRQHRMKLFVAFNYGGRAEILDAARRFDAGGEEDFAALLYAPDMTDPDVLVRTQRRGARVSNFLLWQSAYSELFFVDALWPDFDERAPARRDR